MAYLLVKLVRKEDIRNIGSGNSGATNAGRALGGWGFGLVLVLDALKGLIPVYFLDYYCHAHNLPEFIILLGGAAVIIGHGFPIYLGFKGGKGVATGLGVFAVIAPLSLLVSLGVFIFVVFFTRMISAGSIFAAVALPVTTAIMLDWFDLRIIFTSIVCVLIIFWHRKNIRRILDGTENKINISRV
jgi:glycerol-3-phosphate acyltransferase PlsY